MVRICGHTLQYALTSRANADVVASHANMDVVAGASRSEERVQGQIVAVTAELKEQRKKIKKLAKQQPASSASAEPRRRPVVNFQDGGDSDLEDFCESIAYVMNPASLTSADGYASFHPMALGALRSSS